MSHSMSQATPRTIHVLLCHRDLEMARVCLGSLPQLSEEPVRFVVHDDGSLTTAGLDLLDRELPIEKVWRRAESDDVMNRVLAPYPALLAFRRSNPLALKVLDLLALGEEEAVFYCDSDVLFVAPFRGLFSQLGEACAVFMRDLQNAYSVRSWHLLREPRLRLTARVNTGIIHARRSLLDLDLLEWFFSRREYQATPVWAEQTAWALLAGRTICRHFAPRQISIPRRALDLEGASLAFHFVGPSRHLLPEARRLSDRCLSAAEIRYCDAPGCGPVDLLCSEVARRLRRSR